MNIIARVRNIHADGTLIAKANGTPNKGDPVNDGQSNLVGVVGDVFGPVSGPYVSIRPRGDKKGLHRLTGAAVFIGERRNEDIGERRNGTWKKKGRTKTLRT